MNNKIIHHSFPVQIKNIYSLLNEYQGAPRVFWKQKQGDLIFLGFGMIESLFSEGEDRFVNIEILVSQLFGKMEKGSKNIPDFVRPRIFGGFSFQIEDEKDDSWKSFPAAKMVLPKILFTHDGKTTWATFCLEIEETCTKSEIQNLIEDEKQKILKKMDSSNNNEEITFKNIKAKKTLGMNKKEWHKIINSALNLIGTNKLKKVVLARTCQFVFSETFKIKAMIERLSIEYPDCYIFMFEYTVGQIFYGASPENLISIDDSEFETIALAGSIKRGKNKFEDDALILDLLNSEKDLREHDLVVKSIKEKLKPFTENVDYSKTPGLRKLKNIFHLETKIIGKMKKTISALSLMSSLHPTPALGGSPSVAALEYIQQAEPFSRGWYAGPVGWVDSDGDGVFAVAIRSGLINENKMILFAGAGIVKGSDPEKEWEETNIKFQALLNMLTELGVQHEI